MKKKISKLVCTGTMLLSSAFVASACNETPPPPPPPAPEITSIELIIEDTNTFSSNAINQLVAEYDENIVIDTTDIDLTVFYNDSTTKTIKDGFTITLPSTLTTGEYNPNWFTVTYDGFSQECELILKEYVPDIEEITITGIPESVDYGYDFYELITSDTIQLSYNGTPISPYDYTIDFQSNNDVTTETNKSYIIITGNTGCINGSKSIEVIINPLVYDLKDYLEDKFWEDETFKFSRATRYSYNDFMYWKDEDSSWDFQSNVSIEIKKDNNYYFEFSDAGDYQLEISITPNSSNYVIADTAECSFVKNIKINPIDLADLETFHIEFYGVQYYGGKEITPDIGSIVSSETIYYDEYDYSYNNNIEACTWEEGDEIPANAPNITITGKGNFTGTYIQYFQIKKQALLSKNIIIDDNENYWETINRTYTGQPITIDNLVVKYNYDGYTKKVLDSSLYNVEYSNNIQAGLNNEDFAVITINLTEEGAKNFTATDATKNFFINKANLNIIDYVSVEDVVYDRQAHLPEVTLKEGKTLPETVSLSDFKFYKRFGNEILEATTDYDYTGTQYRLVLESRNYSATTEGSFRILKREIPLSAFSGLQSVEYYSPNGVTFDISYDKNAEFKLEDDEWNVSYKNNNYVGNDAACIIKFTSENYMIEDYSSYTHNFSIIKRPLTEADIIEQPYRIYNPISNASILSSTGKVKIDNVEINNVFNFMYSDLNYSYFSVEHNYFENAIMKFPKQSIFTTVSITHPGCSAQIIDYNTSLSPCYFAVGDTVTFTMMEGIFARLQDTTDIPSNTITLTITEEFYEVVNPYFPKIAFEIYDEAGKNAISNGQPATKLDNDNFYINLESARTTLKTLEIDDNTTPEGQSTKYDIISQNQKNLIYLMDSNATSTTFTFESNYSNSVFYRVNKGEGINTNSPLTLNGLKKGDVIEFYTQTDSVTVTIADKTNDTFNYNLIEEFYIHFINSLSNYDGTVFHQHTHYVPIPVMAETHEYVVNQTNFSGDIPFAISMKFSEDYGYTTDLDGHRYKDQIITINIFHNDNPDVIIKKIRIKILDKIENISAPVFNTSDKKNSPIYHVGGGASLSYSGNTIFNTIRFYAQDDSQIMPGTDGYVELKIDETTIYFKGNMFYLDKENTLAGEIDKDGYMRLGNTNYYYNIYTFNIYNLKNTRTISVENEEDIILKAYEKVNRFGNVESYSRTFYHPTTGVYNGIAYTSVRVGDKYVLMQDNYTIYYFPGHLPHYLTGNIIVKYNNAGTLGNVIDTNVISSGTYENGLTPEQFRQAINNLNAENLENGEYGLYLNLNTTKASEISDITFVEQDENTPLSYIKVTIKTTDDTTIDCMIVFLK